MKKEIRYCNICHKDCEYQILANEDVEAMGSSHVVARDSSHVVAWDSSHVVARDSSHVVARDSSHVVAWDSSHVEARDSSHVVARDSSHVVAWDSSHVVAWDSSHVEAYSPYTAIVKKSSMSKIKGGNIIGDKIIPARQWLEKCGVEVKRGYAILFKSVEQDFTTKNKISFKPRTKHEAPDWNPNFKEECGAGIHYCPTVEQCKRFRDKGVYVACRVKVSDMADLPAFAVYPDKIRAKGGYALYRVNDNGEKIPTNPK